MAYRIKYTIIITILFAILISMPAPNQSIEAESNTNEKDADPFGSPITEATCGSDCVPVGDFQIECPIGSKVIKGETADIHCKVTSADSFNSPVTLSCKSDDPPAPPGPTASCLIDPTEVTPPINGEIEFTLRVITTAATPVGPVNFII